MCYFFKISGIVKNTKYIGTWRRFHEFVLAVIDRKKLFRVKYKYGFPAFEYQEFYS
jgi:hypothetical protein